MYLKIICMDSNMWNHMTLKIICCKYEYLSTHNYVQTNDYLVWFLCLMAYQPWRIIIMPNVLLEEQLWYYLTHRWGTRGVLPFLKDICPNVNVIARLEFELAKYDVAVL